MLYKKNQEKELKKELFENPTCEYRGTPFWAWNCRMNKQILTEQIEQLKDMGFGGFHMHSRDGMDNPYLSDEFMGLIDECVKKAEKEDMLAWLYDEDRWPSGAAGGLVTENPKYRERSLNFIPQSLLNKVNKDGQIPYNCNVTKEADKATAIKEGYPYFIGAYDIILDDKGYLVSYKKINKNAKAKGKKWYAYSLTDPCKQWFNDKTYADTLQKEAIAKFINITHERYKEVVGKSFDKSVPAIFTDEPQFHRRAELHDALTDKVAEIPWTYDFDKSFKRKYGYDLIDFLPEVFFDLPLNKPSIARYHAHDHACALFTEAFSKQIGKWCDKNGIKFTGHLLLEETLSSQTSAVGDTMRAYGYYGLPGMDLLCNHREYTTAKQCQSGVHQYGKEGMLSELYGVTNWDFDFRGHKYQGDWQAALGVTVRVPHLSWVSMAGPSKRDYPAAISYQSSWYKEYKYVENHFARLNTALTRGKPVVKVAVVHPIENFWLYYGPISTSSVKRNNFEKRFTDVIDWLLYNQIDFDFICEGTLPDLCKNPSVPLKVGKMQYDAVIVPGMDNLRSSTASVLSAFEKAGGKLVFMGEKPVYADAKESDDIQKTFASSTLISFEEASLISALEDNRSIKINNANGSPSNDYIYQMRADGKDKWLFICNGKWYTQTATVDAKNLVLTIKGEYEPILYDTVSGEIKAIPFTAKKGNTVIPLSLYLHDSVLLKLTKSKNKKYAEVKENATVIKTIDYKASVPFTLSEPNVVLFDIGEYTYDNNPDFMPEEEILRLDKKVRGAIGIPPRSTAQPWSQPEIKPEHTISIRYSFDSEITVKDARLALETAEDSIILFDGNPVEIKIDGYFTDKFIKTVPLPTITAGKHTITVTQPISERTFTEASFLIGSFGVRVNGTQKTLIALPDKLSFGSITNQALPFYGANVTYSCEFTADEDCVARLHANDYRGALLSVKCDGEDCGKIVYAPYNVEVPVKKGKHTFEITLFASRINCFGSLHNADPRWSWWGPSSWFTTGDGWSYEYQLRPVGIMRSPVISLIKK